MHQEREKGKRIAWLWAQNCAFICIKLREGKGYGSVSIARLCSCILHGLTSGPGFSAYRHLLLGTFHIQ